MFESCRDRQLNQLFKSSSAENNSAKISAGVRLRVSIDITNLLLQFRCYAQGIWRARRETTAGANLSNRCSPSDEQEDLAQHGKLLQHASADGERRRLSYVVVN
jgi:hypothetical protein